MHYTTVKGILSAKNGMNLYRGCQHGCIYCDSRSACYHMEHDFEDVEVKENAIPLLEDALRRKRKPCMIGMGAMTDPYIPLEERLCHTRQALELALRHGFGATLITKSTRILRDIDLLKRINERTKCVIQMTMTTYDEALCRKIEPNVSTTRERFAALKTLREAGIPTVVWLCPILPFLNDTAENVNGILDYCFECSDYPCRLIKSLEKSYSIRYQASLMENSEFVRQYGLDLFMKAQEKRYTCPNCGGIISIHDKECSECHEKMK